MTSLWEMQAELHQEELLEDARRTHVCASPSRRRRSRVFNLSLPKLRRLRRA
jgi:hypothetical protein